MIRQRLTAAAALFTVAGAVACATDGPTAPGAPAATAAPAAASSGSRSTSWANQQLTKAQLDSILESEKRRIHLESERSKTTYDSLKVEWDRFLKTKPSPTNSAFLMCDPLQYTGDTKIIGPEGGDMSVGPHKLSIPRGALASATVVTGEMPVTSDVQVRLSPHGLQFKSGVRLELSYKHCYRPDAAPKSVAYVNDLMEILEWPLTSDRANDGLAQATIQHFSGYAIAWSRKRTY